VTNRRHLMFDLALWVFALGGCRARCEAISFDTGRRPNSSRGCARLLDDYVGEYRFARRPNHVVRITRDGGYLFGESGGQRHVLASVGEHSLVAMHHDGEGRFRRNRRGEVTGFVYYEFGRRLGIARRLSTPSGGW
jgi:hypothetical protein